MKRKILLISLLLCPLFAFGQEKAPFKNKYSVGVGAGLGLHISDAFEGSGSIANLIVQPHLMFEGQFTKHSGMTIGASYTRKTSALSIPLMYKYHSNVLDVALGGMLILPIKTESGYAPGIMGARPSSDPEFPFNYGIGARLRLSKSFNFDQKWWFEPFFMINCGKYDELHGFLHEDNFMDISVGISFRMEL